MIIIGYHLIGKSTVVKNNEGYVILNTPEYEGQDNWVSRYIGAASLLSDIGVDVFVAPRKEIIQELVKREYGALLVYPTPELKDEWVERAVKKFLVTRDNRDALLAQHILANFEEDIAMLRHFATISDGTLGYEIETLSYDLNEILSTIRNMTVVKNNTSRETFIWGVSADHPEKATAYTDNLISIMMEKKTGTYYLIIDEEIIDNGSIDELAVLVEMLKEWYEGSPYALEPQHEFTLDDIYEDMSITVGQTISEIIHKLEAFLYVANDN